MPTETDLIVRADEVDSFTLPGDEGVYESQCLVDREGVRSESLNVNRFTLKAGRTLKGLSHPVGNDECYYVLRGRARLTIGGDTKTGAGARVKEVGPDTAIFIPGGTFHGLENPYDEDFRHPDDLAAAAGAGREPHLRRAPPRMGNLVL